MKSLFATRTFWFNFLSGLALFLALPEFRDLASPQVMKFVVLAIAGINIGLRYVTTTPVKSLTSNKPYVLPLILAAGLSLSACASVPAKQKAVMSLQTTETALGAAQDAERQLCDPVAAAVTPPKPITACTGQTATTIGLTTERHQQIAGALAKAFDAQAKAAIAIQAWKAGDPVPASVNEISADVKVALSVVQQLTLGPKVSEIVSRLQGAMDDITRIANELAGGR